MRKQLLGLLSLVFLLANCGIKRDNFSLSKTFIERPSTIVMAHTSGLETPHFYRGGNQGLLDLAINSAVGNDVSEQIRLIKTDHILDTYFYELYGNAFRNVKFNPVRATEVLDIDSLAQPPIDSKLHAPYDFRFLKTKYHADYAIILENTCFGCVRLYYGFIPMGPPEGYANIKVYVVDLTDNTLLGYFHNRLYTPALGEWDTPPHYKPLTDACQNALTGALTNTLSILFNWETGPPPIR